MKKIIALLLSFVFVFLLSSCGEKPVADPETTVSTAAVTQEETTEKPLPYWDTHEIGTYAGLVNGERFSGDFDSFIPYVKCKNGDVILIEQPLTGMRENMSSPNLAEEEMIFYPDHDIYYIKSLGRYSAVWDYDWKPTNQEASQNCDEIIITKGNHDFYYNEKTCSTDDSDWIDANGEFVVSVHEDSWEESGEIKKIIERYYWKKGAGLIGIYVYDNFGKTKEINIRFTSKTADGWKMDETIVPNALEGSERKWPEKLWPEEYKGLDDPELLAILNEY